jgi:uncharacterized membrane protein YhaH (DUF805 family)
MGIVISLAVGWIGLGLQALHARRQHDFTLGVPSAWLMVVATVAAIARWPADPGWAVRFALGVAAVVWVVLGADGALRPDTWRLKGPANPTGNPS